MTTRVISFVATGLLVIGLGNEVWASEPENVSAVRHASDYANADGRAPDGLDNGFDDTEAIQRALNAGPGLVQLGPGVYRCSGVTVPSRVTLAGRGLATTVRSSGGAQIVAQSKLGEWSIRDLVFDGGAEGDWHTRKDHGQSAIVVDDCREFTLDGITVRNFHGAGIQLKQTILEFHDGYPNSRSHLHRITATNNYIGVRFDFRAEYIHATHLSCQFNVIGCVIHSGNVQIAASGFNGNTDGMLIEDKKNGSHGCVTGCILNHNERYALQCRGVRNGMAITGCAFFYGAIKLEKCVGVNITSGMISCSIDTRDNDRSNRIAGNFVIENPPGYSFDFSGATIVEDNFDAAGSWARNTPQ